MRTQEAFLALALTAASQLSVPAGVSTAVGNHIIIHAEARQWTDAAVIAPRAAVADRKANSLFVKISNLNLPTVRHVSTYEKESELTKSKVIPALLGLGLSSSDDAEDATFPFNVPDELTESQAKDLSRVLAQGVPDREWVEAIRTQLNS